MKKITISLSKFGKYLREISVVVIGVAITLLASYWITSRNEKRDMKLYLDAIKMELEESIKNLDSTMDFLQKQVEYANYIKLHDKTSFNLDTVIANYGNNIWRVGQPSCNTYAFDMFKLSGSMRLMSDKDLLLSIWKCYSRLQKLDEMFTEGFRWKLEETKQEKSYQPKEGKENNIPMYNFYTTSWPSNMVRECRSNIELLKKTIAKLDKKPFEVPEIKVTKEIKTYHVTDDNLDKYLGFYSSKQIPLKFTITKSNGKLIGHIPGQPSFSLEATDKDKFELVEDELILEFNPTDKAMVLSQSGNVFYFTREE